ncbi:hypothetical protein [Gluconobacter wancherniae]|uniref:Copper resistance protein D domain-containing protein n=1 Tax=Gluconobacter wancherniae NBRC 103581 TaxID=656744 RepID=A0A511AZ59_9PROT|nr:hypothetical protein [Gluconobacter wancherniae]MBF0853652.1 hypothetical protein [Gluconobacter wancherniae]MBS1063126.1 hypothetical protein [Gluconobacter wancherniae]MBS1088969.1 hypothetical protein [Gluconobacter wancherniae]MBS1094141.1 hypothetical protein [Gluconobacter wancherniae]GBD55603.1 hypothetical protein NBRC103581_00165 [Gluconobacter wancherniae NBRC 103581]
MTGSIIWSIVLAIHLLSMAYWVGGSIYSTLVVRSTLGLLDAGPRQSVQLQGYTRFFRGLWQVVPFSLLSGWALVLHEGGFGAVAWPVNLMQVLAIVMAALFVSTVYGPFRRARRALRPQAGLFDTLRHRTAMMAGLGVLTILVAAMARGL